MLKKRWNLLWQLIYPLKTCSEISCECFILLATIKQFHHLLNTFICLHAELLYSAMILHFAFFWTVPFRTKHLEWQWLQCTWSQPSRHCAVYRPQEWVLCLASVGCCRERSSRSLRHAQCNMSPSVHPTWGWWQTDRGSESHLVWARNGRWIYLLNFLYQKYPRSHNMVHGCDNCFYPPFGTRQSFSRLTRHMKCRCQLQSLPRYWRHAKPQFWRSVERNTAKYQQESWELSRARGKLLSRRWMWAVQWFLNEHCQCRTHAPPTN